MDDTFIAFAGGTGLICINPWNKDKLVLYFLMDFGKAGNIIADSVFVICGTGPDNDKEFIAFACEDIPYLVMSLT